MASNLTAVPRDMDRRHHPHPFTDAKGVRVIARAEGVHMWTARGSPRARRHGGPAVRERRLRPQGAGRGRPQADAGAALRQHLLPHLDPATAELAARLAEVTPEGFNRVFFGDTGSDANDTVCKMARRHWNARGGKTEKTTVSRKNACHGATMAASNPRGLVAMRPPPRPAAAGLRPRRLSPLAPLRRRPRGPASPVRAIRSPPPWRSRTSTSCGARRSSRRSAPTPDPVSRRLDGHPLVAEGRGRGPMAAIEIVEDKASRKGFDPGRKAGLLVREGLAARSPGPRHGRLDGDVAVAGHDPRRRRRDGRRGRARRGATPAARIGAGDRRP